MCWQEKTKAPFGFSGGAFCWLVIIVVKVNEPAEQWL
jgi:hypothetical protein